MKFIENFKIHIVSQRTVNLSYLEHVVQEQPVEVMDFGLTEIPGSTIGVKLNTLSINLENKRILSRISRDEIVHLQSLGVDPIQSLQSVMIKEQELGLEKQMFYHCLKTARENNSYQEFSGVRKWFYNLVGYKPMIWVKDPNFIKLVYNSSREILSRTRQDAADWIVVSPKVASVLSDHPQMIIHQNNSLFDSTTMANEIGLLNSLRVYSSLLIDTDQILIGRKSKNDHDKLVGAAVTESEWLNYTESSPDAPEVICLQRHEKVFEIPGSEDSYVKWNFSIEKPDFWKWFFNLFRK